VVGCSARIFPEFNLIRHISSKPAMTDRRRLGLVSCDHSDIVAQPFAISPCSLFPPWFPDPIFPCQSRCPRYKKNVRPSISLDPIPCPTAPSFLTSRRAEINPTLHCQMPLICARIYEHKHYPSPQESDEVDHLQSQIEDEHGVVLIIRSFIGHTSPRLGSNRFVKTRFWL
jgi:hypothetical protein